MFPPVSVNAGGLQILDVGVNVNASHSVKKCGAVK